MSFRFIPFHCRVASAAILLAAACQPRAVLGQMQMPACHAMPSGPDLVAPEALPAPHKLTGIGNLHFPIGSKNPETQAWFDQGMNLVFDFWDYEANRAFEQAIRTDPDCAICHWALAESLGIHNSEARGYAQDEMTKAVSLRNHADKRERMYIDAGEAETGSGSTGKRNKGGSAEMLRKIARKYPQDVTARLMLAEALQDGYKEGKPGPGTAEMITLLEGILRDNPKDSAANHLWIHAVEASPHPEQALRSAEILGELAPNSGHMTHMPGHIFYRTGDYARAQVAFDLSTSVDEAYMKAQHVDADDDWNYVHNLMYSIANLLEEGQTVQAAKVSAKLTAARGVRAATLYPWSTRDSMTRLDPQLPVWLRSGNWRAVEQHLVQVEAPAKFPNLQILAVSLVAFARGMEGVEAKDYEAATRYSAELDAQLWRLSQQVDGEDATAKTAMQQPSQPAKAQNQMQPTDPSGEAMLKNLAILSLELRAAILISSGKMAESERLFAQARREETELGYHEPPAFIRPVAEQEAELLMAAGETAKAEAAYRRALEDRPNSGFSLYGLAKVSERSGDTSKTAAAYAAFLKAWQSADQNLPQVEDAKNWMAAHASQAASIAALQPSGAGEIRNPPSVIPLSTPRE